MEPKELASVEAVVERFEKHTVEAKHVVDARQAQEPLKHDDRLLEVLLQARRKLLVEAAVVDRTVVEELGQEVVERVQRVQRARIAP